MLAAKSPGNFISQHTGLRGLACEGGLSIRVLPDAVVQLMYVVVVWLVGIFTERCLAVEDRLRRYLVSYPVLIRGCPFGHMKHPVYMFN